MRAEPKYFDRFYFNKVAGGLQSQIAQHSFGVGQHSPNLLLWPALSAQICISPFPGHHKD